MGKTTFLRGLNELRALAALGVVFHHIELYKLREGIPSFKIMSLFINIGANCVYIFFVLSGFLITHLLLNELKINKKINLFKFYMRRGLRIWPVYYLLFIISFFILPELVKIIPSFKSESNFYERISSLSLLRDIKAFFLYLFMMPNLGLYDKAVVGISQAWSIGVEEQFYLIWPLLISFFKKSIKLILLFIILYYFSYLIFEPINVDIANFLKYLKVLFPVYFMGIGALGAKFYEFRSKIWFYRIFNNILLFSINTILLLYFTFYPLDQLLYAFIIVIEIVFLVSLGAKFNVKINFLDFIGKISYGVYMYHPLVMFFSFWLLKKIVNPVHNVLAYNLLSYFMIFSFTLIISYFSYTYFESYFMKIKDKKYTNLKDNA